MKVNKIVDESLLTESEKEDVLDAVADGEIQPDEVISGGQVEKELNKAFKIAQQAQKRGGREPLNLLFIGPAGTGKTSRIVQWAESNNVNFVSFAAATKDATDLNGVMTAGEKEVNGEKVKRALVLQTDFLDKLDEPNSVLFLDELNRAHKSVRGTLLTLIQSHKVEDRYFPNLLFTVAAVNPSNEAYTTDVLEMAEKTRFKDILVVQSKEDYLQYARAQWGKDIKAAMADGDEEEAEQYRRELAIIEAMFDPDYDDVFDWDFDDEQSEIEGNETYGDTFKALNYRTMSNAVRGSMGNPDDFADDFNFYANPAVQPAVRGRMDALKNSDKFKDKDDKANSVFKQKAASNSDILRKALGL